MGAGLTVNIRVILGYLLPPPHNALAFTAGIAQKIHTFSYADL